MQDWMFETGAEALTWPEPQPQTPEGGPWFPIKSGGDDDWLVPLSTSSELPGIDVPPPSPPPSPTPGEYYDPGDYGGWDGHDSSEPWLPQLPPPNPYDACEDRRADTLADEFKNKISQKPDYRRQEYHSVIWRDDSGGLHMTEPVAFNGSYPADPSAMGLDRYSRVVGLLHNHPEEVLINGSWVPASHGWVHGGDWQTAQWWVTNHNLDQNNFSLYLAYQGQVREYDWKDNFNRPVFDDQNDEDAQQSGDYIPGASC
ncbi:MAG: hypothetical protein FD125_1634 [bacterium]|nr:MAG: hypothetical protein FD125_1634 [bacterium]